MHSVASVRVSVCNALAFESLDLVIHFWYGSTPSESSGQVCILRSLHQSQGYSNKNVCLCVLFGL